MSLLPLFFGGNSSGRRNRGRYYDDDYSMIPYGGYAGRSYDPFDEVNSALSEMDQAMRYINREVGRLSGGGVGNMLQTTTMLPEVVEENGQKKIQYNFDTRGFKPEDISLKTSDGRLVVSARHLDEGDSHRVMKEFHRMVAIPEGVNVQDLKSRLSNNGVLQVEAPYNPPAIENKPQYRDMPITHEPSTKSGQDQRSVGHGSHHGQTSGDMGGQKGGAQHASGQHSAASAS